MSERPLCVGCDFRTTDTNTDANGLRWERRIGWRDSGCPSVRDEVLYGHEPPLACAERFPVVD